MILEGLVLSTKFPNKVEHMNGWDAEAIISVIVFILWFILWISAILHVISCTRVTRPRRLRNTEAGIILSVLSWPFYYLFYFTGAVCN